MDFQYNKSNEMDAIRDYNNSNNNFKIIIILTIICISIFFLHKIYSNQNIDDNYNIEILEEEYDSLNNYKSVNELEVGKSYLLLASKTDKYDYSMYLSRNSTDGMYASFIYYFPDKTRIIFNLPPSMLIMDDQIYDFCIKGKLYKDMYGPKDYKIDVKKEDVIYAFNATFKAEEPIDINSIKSVDELVEGQNYYFNSPYFDGEINWTNWPRYLIYHLKDETEIWFNIEENEETFDRNNVYVSGTLSIEKRFKDNDNVGFTVYIIK